MTQKILAKLMSFAGINKLGLFKIAIASSFLVIVPQGQVKAALLTVANNSFETPVITNPSGSISSTGLVGGWTFAGAQQGFFNPSLGETFSPGFGYGPSPVLPDGNQVAYSNGGTISQTLSATLQTNTVYTLGVYVGRRQNVAFAGYNIELLAGNTVLASNNSVTPAAGSFGYVTVDYTSGISVTPGQALQIRLTSNGVQTNFDNITLDAASIPEPSAILGLLGFGLLGIASKLRQKQ
ncbi:MAG: PEP-CTERM sorting domain-containing protein [Microcystis sp. LE19-131.1A]|uniref:PEP-CTERM sorting domain-containing protein n=1 Tax=Microcystis sp. LE19-131.1A TaxID=3016439 RepID=UPI0022C77503|nr:PEP-CTERM sorting domain-containing protein [Microcystis sp. LE19-131.1A]MCZ8244048.1 PEP-CTERM sorting domain-containing protein [Microcystis sp. LE19-131.1A]